MNVRGISLARRAARGGLSIQPRLARLAVEQPREKVNLDPRSRKMTLVIIPEASVKDSREALGSGEVRRRHGSIRRS